jgi:hypothetical protein
MPVACLASTIITNEDNEKELYYQVSTHNPIDNYSKKVARNVAVGRLALTPRVVKLSNTNDITVDLTTKLCAHNITLVMMKDFLDTDSIISSTAAIKAARKWVRNWFNIASKNEDLGKHTDAAPSSVSCKQCRPNCLCYV